MNYDQIKAFLDKEVQKRNNTFELSQNASADPVQIASIYKDEFISLICALFAYGNAKQIVKFLSSLDFSILNSSEEDIKKELKNKYYRFQTPHDIIAFFIALRRIKQENSLNDIFLKGYDKQNILTGVNEIINQINKHSNLQTHGFKFLISQKYNKTSNSTYKRWLMFLRWMVRKDNIDMGLWSGVSKANLLIPLDTHTHKVSLYYNLIQRKSYDFKAVLQLSDTLRSFDENDPIKYDFALYRLGQEKLFTN